MSKKIKKLHVSFILDETGSMLGYMGQVESGYNEYVESLKASKQALRTLFTLTRFNSEKVWVEHDAVKIRDVGELSDYSPAACTPLYDAVGRTIRALEKQVNGKDRVLVIIQTDGQENASKEYDMAGIRALIEEKKGAGWEFVFMGADQDAWVAGFSIGTQHAKSYMSVDTKAAYRDMADGTVSWMETGSYKGSGDGD